MQFTFWGNGKPARHGWKSKETFILFFFPLFDAINNTHIVTPLSSGGAKQIEFNKLHLLMLWFRLSFTFAASATGGQQVLANYVSKKPNLKCTWACTKRA